MPSYTPKQLGYNLFTRSHQSSRFDEFDGSNSFLCWIDLLGVQSMAHSAIVTAVKRALRRASECSATGVIRPAGQGFSIMVGTPNTALQFSLIGDALVLVEKDMPDTPDAAALGLIYRATLLSMFLHQDGYAHKGVITRGQVHCEKFDDSSVITGKGVVQAYQLEKKLMVAGLFYDQTVARFIQQRAQQIEQHSYYAPLTSISGWPGGQYAPGLDGVIFSQYYGWEKWKNVISNGPLSETKITNAQALISALTAAHQLP